MKKIFVVIAACAMFVACGKKAATEEEQVVEETTVEVVEEVAPEAEAVATVDEKMTLIDEYVKACEEENEVEATRVAKRIDEEYKDQLTSADIERMTNASAALASKRAEQGKEAAQEIGNALKNLNK